MLLYAFWECATASEIYFGRLNDKNQPAYLTTYLAAVSLHNGIDATKLANVVWEILAQCGVTGHFG